MRSAKILISLRGCAGWSESSLVSQVLKYVLSCTGSLFSKLPEVITNYVLLYAYVLRVDKNKMHRLQNHQTFISDITVITNRQTVITNRQYHLFITKERQKLKVTIIKIHCVKQTLRLYARYVELLSHSACNALFSLRAICWIIVPFRLQCSFQSTRDLLNYCPIPPAMLFSVYARYAELLSHSACNALFSLRAICWIIVPFRLQCSFQSTRDMLNYCPIPPAMLFSVYARSAELLSHSACNALFSLRAICWTIVPFRLQCSFQSTRDMLNYCPIPPAMLFSVYARSAELVSHSACNALFSSCGLKARQGMACPS